MIGLNSLMSLLTQQMYCSLSCKLHLRLCIIRGCLSSTCVSNVTKEHAHPSTGEALQMEHITTTTILIGGCVQHEWYHDRQSSP